jgi:hypothetical protein
MPPVVLMSVTAWFLGADAVAVTRSAWHKVRAGPTTFSACARLIAVASKMIHIMLKSLVDVQSKIPMPQRKQTELITYILVSPAALGVVAEFQNCICGSVERPHPHVSFEELNGS